MHRPFTFRVRWVAAICLLFLGSVSNAQQGVPPPEEFTAQINTNYAQHEDFMPSLVHRLNVPPGFEVFAAATGLGKPRIMAISSEGWLYITRRDAGDVLLLKDLDGNGKFDDMQTIVANFPSVHGITIYQGWLYLCSNMKLTRGQLQADGTVGPLDTLINDLPNGGQHPNRTIAFGPDGKLYISIGSDCNDCRETNPEHASIIQVNADGSGRRSFARNLRNTIGFDWHPTTGEMWGMDHGTDYKGDTIPHEELNRIIDGGDYGWPYVYDKRQSDLTREDPIGTTKQAYALTTQPAVALFPAHSAPMNFKFLNNDNLPSGYRNDALVTWHGSWNRKRPEGFNVQRIQFGNGEPGNVKDFLTGFFRKSTRSRFGRPVGIVISTEGRIYISDDANGVIYCVKRPGNDRSVYSKTSTSTLISKSK